MNQPKPQNESAPKDQPSGSRRPCLLVIDDDSSIRAMLQGALESHYEVVCLPNGEEVVRSISAYSPRLLLLDINMPGSDGYEICKKVRAEARNQRLPVLFMTIRKDDATFLKSLDSGGDALICKPFEIGVLREKIDYMLKGGAAS